MRYARQSFTLTFLVSLLGIVPETAIAQTSTATLHGTITDTGGGVVPGVTVKLEAPATSLTRDAVTNTAECTSSTFSRQENT